MRHNKLGSLAIALLLVAGCGGGVGLNNNQNSGPCGNGQIDQGEDCDGNELGQATCLSLGWDGGDLGCSAACFFDTSACTGTGPECGNGEVEYGEVCDATNLDGQTCQSLGFDRGTLACAEDCTFDISSCIPANCGNAVVDAGEQCDGTNLDGQTCTDQGFAGGSLGCTVYCAFDTSGCNDCGNDQIDTGEDCDGAELGGATCLSLGLADGTLACSSTCTYDVSGCSPCGDGTLDPGEQCDSANLDGESCQSLGYPGGTLACSTVCLFDVSGCTGGDCSATGGALACGGSESDDTSTSAAAVDIVNNWTGLYCPGWAPMHGPEIVYEFVTGNQPEGIEATLTGLTSDLDLFALVSDGTGCNANLPCVDFSGSGGTDDEQVAFLAQPNTTYYLVVDGFGNNPGAEGPFTLSVQCVNPELNCSDTQDNDGDGDADCADSDCRFDPACRARQIWEIFPFNDANDPCDLAGTTITFVPDAAATQGYTFSTNAMISGFPTQPGTGNTSQVLTFSQVDDTVNVSFPSSQSVTFFGTPYTELWVNTHGNVTFGAGDTDPNESAFAFTSGLPRIAAHWDRLDPLSNGTVTVDFFVNRMVVTWNQVDDPYDSDNVSIQIELFWDGTITITTLTFGDADGLTGITEGGGVTGAPEVNFR